MKKLVLIIVVVLSVFCGEVFGFHARSILGEEIDVNCLTSYPSGTEREFDSLYSLIAYLKNPEVEKPKKNEFETVGQYKSRLQKFNETLKQPKLFTLKFKPCLEKYSHVYGGFPFKMAIYDAFYFKRSIGNPSKILKEYFESYERGFMDCGTFIFSNYCALEKDPFSFSKPKNPRSEVKFKVLPKKTNVELIVLVPDINDARELKNDEAHFAFVKCVLKDYKKVKLDYGVSVTTTYNLIELEIQKFTIKSGDKEFEVVPKSIVKRNLKMYYEEYPLLKEARKLRKEKKLSEAFAKALIAEKQYGSDKEPKQEAINLQCRIMNDRFKDNGDGTVTDNLTGLMWAKEFGQSITGTLNTKEALGHPIQLKLGGYSDWRVPTIWEHGTLLMAQKFTRQKKYFDFSGDYLACWKYDESGNPSSDLYTVSFPYKVGEVKKVNSNRFYGNVRAVRGKPLNQNNPSFMWYGFKLFRYVQGDRYYY